ncbi:uncharacterized protein SPSK_05039 [Sporothrix schenckii 1099-18]|uniref:Uncharacterized protein n=1 Tax=Sporothrix schenckii 1099-18 TaxID=1397361 RepID=A0A0F2LUQ0_SPOSC|nr:uncharacterized protein SPSK_05039 [Sporothrix schenckii 1099-18]KJR80235.1 hypothetical protein SPSK_05039 [Sporothrix schenckii 1099-18]
MAPADVFAVALAVAAETAAATTTYVLAPSTTAAYDLRISLRTYTTTAKPTATTPSRTAHPTSVATTTAMSSTCWPGPCSPYMAVSFAPFPEQGNSRFISEWGGAAFAAAFGVLAIVHLVQGCYYRLWKVATAAVAGGVAALTGYTLQAVASSAAVDGNVDLQPYLLAAAFVLLQIAPLCITLVPFATLNRLARTRFLPAHDSLSEAVRRPWPANGRWVAAWPVWVLFMVAAGAQAVAVAFLVYCGLTASSTYRIAQTFLMVADLVWTGGLAGQGIVVLMLLAAATQAYATLPPARQGGRQERDETGTVRPSLPPQRRRQIIWLLGTTYGVLALVTMRVVYRTVEAVEAAKGRSVQSLSPSTLPMQKEAASASRNALYALVLDALPTVLAFFLLCACHAGWALPADDARHRASQRGSVHSGGRGSGSNSPADAGVGVGGVGDGGGDNEDMDERRDALHDLHDMGSPGEGGREYFGQSAVPGVAGAVGHMSTEHVLLQQRAALQRHYRQQQRQQHVFRPRHSPPAVVEALARSSLSASLSVSLPRESFGGGARPALPHAPGELHEPTGGAPRRLLARISTENFILFRFLNSPSRSTSGRSGPWAIPWGARSAASRAASQSQSHSRSQNQSQSHGGSRVDGDDPFAGFDDVAHAGLQREEMEKKDKDRRDSDREDDLGVHNEQSNDQNENAPLHDSDSRRTCESPGLVEKEREQNERQAQFE